MPYSKREELPESVRKALSNVPHAQDIYKETFNSAYKQYDEESRAHAAAWGAVKEEYQKGDDDKWHPKD
ncbi:MAG TPA: ChaB family protein [Wenzhouxiangellaceae bacterium]|nr:ChaB family protein [Wenzhouxiangellaceae bacterium]